jgi:hypothetical protein
LIFAITNHHFAILTKDHLPYHLLLRAHDFERQELRPWVEAPSLEIFLASLCLGETVKTETEMVVLDVKELWWYFTMFWVCFGYVLDMFWICFRYVFVFF